MSMFIDKKTDKIEPYYRLSLNIENGFALKKTIVVEYEKKVIDEHRQEFRDLIKFLYVCHYCSNFDINAYRHVENYEKFVKNNPETIFHNIWQQDLREDYNIDSNESEDDDEIDFIKSYIRINIQFFNENKYQTDHDLLNFDAQEVNEIVEKIEKHGTMVTEDIHSFHEGDPKIFMETFHKFLFDGENDSDGEIILLKSEDNYKYNYCTGEK